MKRYPQAEKILLKALAVLLKKFGPKHNLTKLCVSGLSTLYRAWGKPDKAAKIAAAKGH